MILTIAAASLLLILLLAEPSHAKGGSSRQVDAVGPKSEELKNLESQFYSMMNPLVSAYAMPLNGGGGAAQQSPAQTAGAGKGGAGQANQLSTLPNTGLAQPRGPGGGVPQPATQTASAGKGGSGQPAATGGVPQPYDNNTLMGQLFNDATAKTHTANSRYDDLMGEAPGLSADMSRMLGLAETAGDPWYGKAWDTYGNAGNLISQGASMLEAGRGTNKWYDNYARDNLTSSQRLLDTGEIPQPIVDALVAAMSGGVDKTVGSNISDLASRGVINSSVTDRSMGSLSKSVADSMNENYLNAFSTLVSGYQGNAGTAAQAGNAFADNYLRYNDAYNQAAQNMIGLGDSYGKTGSMRVGDYLNTAGGYGNALDLNLKERQNLVEQIPEYYINAAAPMMPAYDFLKTMQQDHWNSGKKDTIVKQGK